ncbi:hypothetical protein [Dyadobacter sp. CY312]|uniref:hypothetical protein n=1 Tax=Dyadobacter sp. CY312 TaxID=2907303 RepID=UPI001F22E1A8|nr:hypothetical protein [Dyadobacter sp. CY312]MCE7041910.1 hypothetical protein [Dyadobacter sp. CY312]
MKKLLVILFFAIVFVGCKDKDEDVAADLGARVAGTYTMTKVGQGGVSIDLPFPGISGSVKVVRKEAEKAEWAIRLEQDGKLLIDDKTATGEIALSESGSKVILKEGGTEAGYVEGNILVIDFVDGDGVHSRIEAKK